MTDKIAASAAWVDGDPLMEAIAAAVWEHCGTDECASVTIDDPRNIAAIAAHVARTAVRAETLRDAEEICDEAGAVYTSKALNEHADAAYTLMARFRRKAEEAESNAAATPAGPAPATDRGTAPTNWIDGHPQLEAIAAAVWEHCDRSHTGIVMDDRRNIAVAALAAVLPAPVGRAAVLRDEAARIRAHCPDHLDSDSAPGSWMACHCAVADDMLRRLAGEAQQDEAVASDQTGLVAGLRAAASEIDGIDFHPKALVRSLDIAAGLSRRLRRMADELQPGSAQDGEPKVCGAREPEPRTGTSPCVLPAGHGGTRHQDKWTNQWPIDLVARSGQPETAARCPEAFWLREPEEPHTWWQSPTRPQRPCPGVDETSQTETEEEA